MIIQVIVTINTLKNINKYGDVKKEEEEEEDQEEEDQDRQTEDLGRQSNKNNNFDHEVAYVSVALGASVMLSLTHEVH